MSTLSRTISTPRQTAGRKRLLSNAVLLGLVIVVAVLLIADLTLLKPISGVAGANGQASQPSVSQSPAPLSDGY